VRKQRGNIRRTNVIMGRKKVEIERSNSRGKDKR
jgi:hypothetical protein